MKVLAVVLIAGLLSACSSDGDAYCETLREERAALGRLADSAQTRSPGYLTDALAVLERLRRRAPQGLRDEWDTLVFAWSDLVDALRESGVDPGVFAATRRPPGVSAQDYSHLKDVAAKLSSPRVRDAVSGINDHARQACSVDLSL